MENREVTEIVEGFKSKGNSGKYMSIWEALGAMLFMIVAGGIVAVALIKPLEFIFPSLSKTDTGMIATVFMMLATIVFLYFQKRWSIKKELGVRNKFLGGKVKFYYVIITLLVSTLGSILLEPYMMMMPEETIREYYDMFFSGNIIITFVVGVLIIPVVEEIIFRGYLLRGLERRYGSVPAIFYSSLIFAVVHFSLIQSPSAFLISVVMSIVYIITRYSLSTLILIHALNNLIAFAGTYFFGSPEDIREDSLMYYINNDTIYIIVYGITLIGYVALLILGFKYVKACNEEK